MRLDLLLDKTKAKGNKEEIRRLPPSIASEERPYDIISPIALDITPSYEDHPSSNTNHKNNLNSSNINGLSRNHKPHRNRCHKLIHNHNLNLSLKNNPN